MREPGQKPGLAPLFRLPLILGVVGHRDLCDTELSAIRGAIEALLRVLRAAQPGVPVQLLSSMAEGADLLVAEVALDLGFDVIALLPYGRAQCREDIATDAARLVFDRLVQRAEVLEMPSPEGVDAEALASPGAARDRQYQEAGYLVARYSSLLISIWDGQDTGHAAGTARVIGYRRHGLAPAEPAGAAFDSLMSAADNDWTYEIRCSRRSTSSPTDATGAEVIGFVCGDRRLGAVEQGLPAELTTLLDRTADFNDDVTVYGDRMAASGRRLAPPSPYAIPETLLYVDRLFVAADWLGVHFGRCFTRALRARYTLWAILALLLLGLAQQQDENVGLANILVVLLVFATGWLLAFWAHRRSWHRRFLNYRALAEALRVDFYCELAGVRAQFRGEFSHENFLQRQDFELEWIRAAMRAVSLRRALYPRAVLPHGFELAYAAWIGDPDPVNGAGQLHYYRQRARALERRQRFAEGISTVLLFTGLALGIVLATTAILSFVSEVRIGSRLRDALVLVLALVSIYGAIFEIYLGEKADRALIRQYRYMESLFSIAARELASARSLPDKLEILRSLGHASLAEHAQWILAHRDKRIDGLRW